MSNLRRGIAIAGAAALLVALVGCSTAMRVTAATTAAPTPTPTSTPTSTPVAVAPARVAESVAASPPPASPISAACAGTPAGTKHIYVSIAQQHLWACTGDVLLTDSAVTTGASALTNVHDATPTGTFRITNKIRNTVLAGHDVNGSWHDAVTYWMPFSGGDGFHDAPWQTFPLGSPLYKTQGSHGCVHLPVAEVAALFNWGSIGTLVTIRS
jgi:lipoprotein-anchoring transpeptidase ErfK/SrfK